MTNMDSFDYYSIGGGYDQQKEKEERATLKRLLEKYGVPEEPEETADRYVEEIKEIADELHRNFCQLNHTDQCRWWYESWERPFYSRLHWYYRAKTVYKLMDRADVSWIIQVIRAMAGKE